jgi:hypothetical protein
MSKASNKLAEALLGASQREMQEDDPVVGQAYKILGVRGNIRLSRPLLGAELPHSAAVRQPGYLLEARRLCVPASRRVCPSRSARMRPRDRESTKERQVDTSSKWANFGTFSTSLFVLGQCAGQTRDEEKAMVVNVILRVLTLQVD